MRRTAAIAIPAIIGLGLVGLAVAYIATHTLAVLAPRGVIAHDERNLIAIAAGLMLLVVVPVFALTIGIAWRYRASNSRATYTPNWDRNRKLEFTWWAIPGGLILTLSIITWVSTHQLDPYRPLASAKPPLTIQVVALDWKWLFIYPEQRIATVNVVGFPQNTPINFEITSDAPMNSFWIPQLGGQIYAMPGMSTQLHLMASSLGSYAGSSANISGTGFAGMKFTAQSMTDADFAAWVQSAQRTHRPLDAMAYAELAKPSQNQPESRYFPADPTLYNAIIARYMMPMPQTSSMP